MSAANPAWSKEIYEASVSSRCWDYTPYRTGWDKSRDCGADMAADDELAAIVAMECALGTVPVWTAQIVERAFRFPGCPHYAFPRAFVDAVEAIGSQRAPQVVHGCFTADGQRKRRMADYLLCLDAWLAGAELGAAAGELSRHGHKSVDWPAVCTDLWQVLGEPTEVKRLLVERLVHRHRWWLKTLLWDDDRRNVFCVDQYLGSTASDEDDYGDPGYGDPYFGEFQSPRVKQLESQIAKLCPHGKWFLNVIQRSSLCGPKAFRFFEKTPWCIGKEKPAISLPSYPLENPDHVPGFLQCEDTVVDLDEAAVWWPQFMAALRGWWRDESTDGEVGRDVAERLGEPTPIKRWLVRLLVRQLEMLTSHNGSPRRLVLD